MDYIQEELARQQLALARCCGDRRSWRSGSRGGAGLTVPNPDKKRPNKRGLRLGKIFGGAYNQKAEPVPIIQTGDAEKTVLRSEKGVSSMRRSAEEGQRALPLRHQPEERRMGLGRSCSRSCEHGVGDGAWTATRMAADVRAVSQAVSRTPAGMTADLRFTKGGRGFAAITDAI